MKRLTDEDAQAFGFEDLQDMEEQISEYEDSRIDWDFELSFK